MSEDRLQKILARAGVATSRRKAEELIQEGRVTINGKVAELGEKADPERDAIKVDSRRIQPLQEHHYFLLNKPKGVMSTVTDPEGRRTVIDFVPPGMRKALVPVGRLDFNTEGLLLLTDDGEFAQRVAHPRYGSVKTYEVKVKGLPTAAQLEKLRAGIVIDGKRTAPARITSRAPFKPAGPRRKGEAEGDNSWWIVELTEGRTRQIREMFFNIGHGVLKLRRVAIGTLRDRALPVGALRSLTEKEVQRLLKSTGRPSEKKPARKAPAAAKAPARKAPAKPSPPPRRAAARKPRTAPKPRQGRR
ncbi:MAG TPA: pseudouridine synthase [Thermoanaerobaculia bacterium]|jgi:23S rRNA pseudouridine2605 synthase|nr:pseudouridine synthase [Thermoanaerobaculia bacterium]